MLITCTKLWNITTAWKQFFNCKCLFLFSLSERAKPLLYWNSAYTYGFFDLMHFGEKSKNDNKEGHEFMLFLESKLPLKFYNMILSSFFHN